MNAHELLINDLKNHEGTDGRLTRGALSKLRRMKEQQERASLGRLAKIFDVYEFRDDVLFRARLRRKGAEVVLVPGDNPDWRTAWWS